MQEVVRRRGGFAPGRGPEQVAGMTGEEKAMTIGLFGILTIIFVVAKLLGLISWAWWLVLLPAWLPVAGFTAIMLVMLIILVILEGK